ncbi:MAG TPA: sigma-70 family RNA polymerase sigma factor [Bacillus bacterium]|nr:sigma-70 family RNA polymerase sigma factor [Bacillus sp. (in: firmicutes)]
MLSYFSQYIYYFSINFDKSERKREERYMVILDKPIDDEENITLIDNIAVLETYDYLTNSKHIEDYIENVELIKKLRILSQHQKNILSMSYIDDLKDKEIAEILCISQQAVSKTRNKTLEKLRRSC